MVLEYGIVLNIVQGTPCIGAIASLSSLNVTPFVGRMILTSLAK